MRIHRVHLEEDAAKLEHLGESGRIHGSERSIVDFNRGGTPLVEIVTEPDFHSPEQAREWLTCCATTLQAARGLRRRHVAGLAALRRERLGPAGRLDRARDQDRAEEHELVRVPRAGRPSRDRAADRAARGGRAGRAGDAPLRSGDRPADAAALKGGGARLPLLPRARPRADRGHRGDARRRPRGAAGAASGAGRAVRARARAEHASARASWRSGAELGDYFERRCRGRRCATATAPRPAEIANWIPQLVERIGPDADPADSKVAPESLAAIVRDGRGQGGQSRCRPRGPHPARRGGRRPARDRRARGARRAERRRGRASPRSSIGRSPPIRLRPSRSGPAT